jgi:hypothetical protein
MKKIFSLFVVALSATAAMAQPPAGDAKPGEWYGEKISTDGAASISDVTAKVDKKEPFATKIKAKVLDVCPKKGCWISLQVDDSTSTTAFVKMKDYAFFLPEAIKGKTIVLDGTVQLDKVVSVEEQKHYAEDAKKSKAEIDAITKPQKQIRFVASGIVVVE